jgi:hypothetical protein
MDGKIVCGIQVNKIHKGGGNVEVGSSFLHLGAPAPDEGIHN